MAFAPVSLILPQYEDYAGWWLKAYAEGTSTPLSMATDATGLTLIVKAPLDNQGFPLTSLVGVRFIPYIDGDFDLFLFPTKEEADANITVNAIQLADDINADPQSGVTINAYKQYPTLSALDADALLLIGEYVTISGHIAQDDGGGNNYEIVPAGTAPADGGSYIDLTASGLQAKGLFPGGLYNVKQWGAVGDGVALDDLAFATAIQFLESRGGGVLNVPAGVYLKGLILNIKKPIRIVGEGQGEDSTGQSGSSVGLTSMKADPALTGFPIFNFNSGVAGNYLSGCGVENIKFLLEGISKSIILDKIESSVFRNIFASTANGNFASENMSLINGCRFNYFEDLYLTGTNDCNTLYLEGEGASPGCTQNVFNRLTLGYGTASGTGIEGALVLRGNVDNNIFYHVHTLNGNVVPGISGTYGLVLRNGATSHARNNLFVYFNGHTKAQSATYGNNMLHYNAETGSVTLDTGAQLNYDVNDNATGGMYETQKLALIESKNISIGDMSIIPGSVTTAARSSVSVDTGEGRFACIDFTASDNQPVGYNFAPPDKWSTGKITGIQLFWSTNNAGGVGSSTIAVELLIGVQPALLAGSFFSSDIIESFNLIVDQTLGNLLYETTLTFTTPLTYAAGEYFAGRIMRTAGAASDNYPDVFKLMSANVLFEADGPKSGGVGPWPQGDLGRN